MFLAVIPAADALVRWVGRGRASRTAPALLAALLVAKSLVNDVAGYFEESLPQLPRSFDGAAAGIVATGYKATTVYRHVPDSPLYWRLAHWIDGYAAHGGRVLVDNGVLGEQLAWRTDAQILGGFIVRNLEHSRANLFRRQLERPQTQDEVRAYLQTYAVEWLVVLDAVPWLEEMTELFKWHAEIGGARIYRSKLPISYFERGVGLLAARTNRISVAQTAPSEELVLRYHYHEMLRCEPDCRIAPFDNPVGGVPFIHVLAPHPAAFTIVNAYEKQ